MKLERFKDQRILLVFVIIGIILGVAIINPKFVAVGNLITIFQQISVLGILTMAMAMLLIGGGIDLSIGNIMVLSGVVMSKVLATSGSLWVALLCGVGVGILCGLVNGVIIAKSRCIPLIITLGMSQVFYGLSLTISEGRIMTFNRALQGLGKTKLWNVFPVMLFVLILMVGIAYVVINYTQFGRRTVAIGGNEKNAFLSGIPVDRYKIMLYALSGLFAAVAAIVFSARIDSITANAGAGYETNALAAAIIGGVTFSGGTGTIGGAFLGCLLMGVLNNAMNILRVPSYLQTIISGAIIVVAVVLSNLDKRKKRI